MCDIENLIDLSFDESRTIEDVEKTTSNDDKINAPAQICPFASNNSRRESIENNPFDEALKLASREFDPFECVEKEASLMGRQTNFPTVNVKVGKLLSLSDDNLLDPSDNENECTTSNAKQSASHIPQFASNATLAGDGSTIVDPNIFDKGIETESPPVSLSNKHIKSDGSAGSSTDDSSSQSNKMKKSYEFRKRLLKLSISNSTYNSPVSRHLPHTDDSSCTQQDIAFNSMMCENSPQMLAAESPLKLIDDDDDDGDVGNYIMSAEPPNSIISERNFEADLEMLTIPMLKNLSTPTHKPTQDYNINEANTNDTTSPALNTALTGLETIRARLRAKRDEDASNQDVNKLLQNLKSLLSNDELVVDEKKKKQANNLLETLCTVIANNNTKTNLDSSKDTPIIPQPIVRQGTFDLELQNTDKDGVSNESADHPQPTDTVQSMPIAIEEVPDVMIKSSATYDGETASEKHDFILPEVEPLSPVKPELLSPKQSQLTESALLAQQVQPAQQYQQQQLNDVSAIVEQFSRLLEQHQLSQQQNQSNCLDIGGASGGGNGIGGNSLTNAPTFIVVMNSSGATQLPNCILQPRTSMHNESGSFESPETQELATNGRRRSLSLSIHDKIKTVHLPISRRVDENEITDFSPPTSGEAHEFKTPARCMRQRGNSFSSGTPYTSSSLASPRRIDSNTGRQYQYQRRSSALDLHHDMQRQHQQQQAIVRPMPISSSNLKVFKPDLRKKKPITTESIIKSNGPLKATIPVTKFETTQKISPPDRQQTRLQRYNLNTSMQMLSGGRMSLTSTPMPQSRHSINGNGSMNSKLGACYPNACSTPTTQRRSSNFQNRNDSTIGSGAGLGGGSINISKVRHSYSAAPTTCKSLNLSTTTATSAGLKRRTLTELKVKSPFKSRIGGIRAGIQQDAVATRTTSKVTQNNCNITTKTTTKPTNSGRYISTSRLINRTSNAGLDTHTNKSKENMQP